ncbi:hypothetical protein EW146_g7979 [Bondarzewia mesenterica]|uniref:EF-hand domain-containing protein n=1 Tax=Bondarzewia mesenterica TaxID=1095465 RepID=A0A4S4LJR9_9AGAM|nr:hypothetical protein EW146_g7979 [Bondarzewia mesenterica]
MDTDPLKDTTAPRYAVESDDEEDEINPLPHGGKPENTEFKIEFKGLPSASKLGGSLVVASGEAGKFWSKGASLGEQQGAVYVNQFQVGLLFRPSWTKATILVSEVTTSLPIWAMNQYAQAVIDYFKPTNIALLDTYPVPVYITARPVPYHEAPVRYLDTSATTPPIEGSELFAPPNLIQTTSAAFMSIIAVSSQMASQTPPVLKSSLVILPSPHVPRPRLPDLAKPNVSSIYDEDMSWQAATLREVDRGIFGMFGESVGRTWEKKEKERPAARRGDAGEGEYKEAFALFDKKGTGAVPRETLGDLLRALGQNPTQAEVADIVNAAPRDVEYKTFLTILNRPDGFKPAGTPEEFIRGFQVFDKEGNGFIGAGELRYVLTQLGEKMSDEEVDELMKGVQVGPDGNVNYESFVRTILSQ